MEEFKKYKIAELTPKSENTIVSLKQKIKQEIGKEIILIAYQQNNKAEG